MVDVRPYIVILWVLWAIDAQANTYASCDATARAAENQCRAAEAALKASDAARSASTAASSGTDINQNCSNLGRDIGQQQGDVGKAQAECSAALSRCDSNCKGAINPAEQPAMTNRAQQCQRTIQKELADLGTAMGNLAGNGAQSAACQQASQGKPPQMPPMQPPQSQNEEKKSMTCDSAEGARYSDCNSIFISKCTKDMNATYCSEFSDRYCGSATVGGQSNLSGSKTGFATAVAGVVVDKGGEGLGSSFCNMVTAYKFCQASGRGECPTCRGLYSYSSPDCQNDPKKCIPSMTGSQLESAKNNCPLDPVFMDPVALKKLEEGIKKDSPTETPAKTGGATPERVGSAGSAAIGGAGRGLSATGPGGAGSGAGSLNGATPESLPNGIAVGMDTGSSGGGSSSGSSNSSEEDADEKANGGPLGSKKPLMPAEAVDGMAKDVSNQFGPNIFSISTAVYRNMCSQGRLTHCKAK